MSTEEPVAMTQNDNNNTNSESAPAAAPANTITANTEKKEQIQQQQQQQQKQEQKTTTTTTANTTPQATASSLFGSVTSTFSSWTSSFQKETEQGFPGTFKRFNDFSQTIQAKAKELPQNIVNLPGSFEAERKNFLSEYNTVTTPNTATKKSIRGSELVAPWQGYGAYEKEMKKRILALSKDQRNFLFSPPEDTSFQFDLKAYSQTAKAALQYDEELAKMRFLLVPQQVQEPIFWRNYFYRVTLEKQAVLSSTDIDPTQHEEQEEEERNDVLFDYPTSDGEENEEKKDDEKTTKSTESKPSTTTKKVEKKSPTPAPAPVKSKEPAKKTDENSEDMEEWERELRKVAGETA